MIAPPYPNWIPGSNPLLDEYLSLYGSESGGDGWLRSRGYDPDRVVERFRARDRLTKQYAWAVPNDLALSVIAGYGPIIEVGAGTGYWARLLQDRGVDVIATDIGAPKGQYPIPHTFTDVLEMDAAVAAAKYADRTLMIIWPPMTSMAVSALRVYQSLRGKRVIYIGEGCGGCNADEAFFKRLDKMKEAAMARIQQWDGIHDYLQVYESKER